MLSLFKSTLLQRQHSSSQSLNWSIRALLARNFRAHFTVNLTLTFYFLKSLIEYEVRGIVPLPGAEHGAEDRQRAC